MALRQMTLLLAFFVGLLLCASAQARPVLGGGSICPLSADGSQITPPRQIGCTLTDYLGRQYVYDGTMGYGQYLLKRDGFNYHYSNAFQLNTGRKPYWQWTTYPVNNFPLWYTDDQQQATTPASGPIGAYATLASTGLTYGSNLVDGLNGVFALATAGDTITVHSLPLGLPVYTTWSYAYKANLTETCEANSNMGVIMSGSPVPAQGNIVVDTGGDNFTLINCEVSHVRDGTGQGRGLFVHPGVGGLTLNGTYFHDNDFGAQSSGNMKTVNLINTMWDHNGFFGASTSHNFYFSGDAADLANPTRLTINGGYSVCTSSAGFQAKLRGEFGTITNFTAAEPSRHGYTDCIESAALDISCGGSYTIGGTDLGTGTVLELGPGAVGNGSFIVRVGADLLTGNCGSTLPPYSLNGTLIQNSWLLLDQGTSGAQVCDNHNPSLGTTCTVKNSKIVCNNNIINCNAAVLGVNTIDGGGNTYFSNRAAAGLAPYPALPSPP